jgi:hypothetical protein
MPPLTIEKRAFRRFFAARTPELGGTRYARATSEVTYATPTCSDLRGHRRGFHRRVLACSDPHLCSADVGTTNVDHDRHDIVASGDTGLSEPPAEVSRHQRPGTADVLVPGRPITLLACRYHGFNQPEPIGTFARRGQLPAPEIAGALDAMPRPTSNVVANCPADFGEKYLLYFSYKSGPPLVVQVAHGGCRYVTNGDLAIPFAPVDVTQRLEVALGEDHL